jgi:hypothetical protein
MTDKPGKPRGKPSQATGGKESEPGRLQTDDRGNVTWAWTDEELLADNTLGAAERMRALVNPSLDIVDDSDPSDPSPFSAPKNGKSGYNPYNSGQLAKESWKKKKDLRQLSKWIELKKKMAEKKED